jgi:hypothetical protein
MELSMENQFESGSTNFRESKTTLEIEQQCETEVSLDEPQVAPEKDLALPYSSEPPPQPEPSEPATQSENLQADPEPEVTFTTFDTGSLDDPNPRVTQGHPLTTSWSHLGTIALSTAISPAQFEGNKRGKKYFLGSDIIAIDCDGAHSDAGELLAALSLEDAIKIFALYAAVIVTTRNHRRAKGAGASTKAACDRFRVFIRLSRRVVSSYEYSACVLAVVGKLAELVPEDAIDVAASSDCARLFYQGREIVTAHDGRTLDVERAIARLKNLQEAQPRQTLQPQEVHKAAATTSCSGFLSSISFHDVLHHYGIQRIADSHAPCPSCGNKEVNPSLQVNKDTAYCHRCKRSFDAIAIVRLMESCSYGEANLKLLSLKAKLDGKRELRVAERIAGLVELNAEAFRRRHGNRMPRNPLNEPLFKKALRSVVVRDLASAKTVLLVDPQAVAFERVDLDSLVAAMPPDYKLPNDIGKAENRSPSADYLSLFTVVAQVEYRPDEPHLMFEGPLGLILNIYQPPLWLSEHYASGAPVPMAEVIPEIYRAFLMHLVNNDLPSYEFLLDWLATAIRDRNSTYLTAVGEEGVGKGILATILENLVGGSNFVKARDTVLKERFNGQLANKKLIAIDEVSLTSKEHLDRLKDLVNPKIEVEAKGKDAKYVSNYANICITSKNFNCVPLQGADRRFSVIELTDTRIVDVPNIRDAVDSLFEEANIALLGQFLWHREVTRDMRIPFTSSRLADMIAAGLAEWENWVITTLAAQRRGVYDLREVQDAVRGEYPFLRHPGRERFRSLAKKYPEKLKFCKSGEKVSIEFFGTPPATPSADVAVQTRDPYELPY